jgi:gliding motility-associated-like protein
MKKFFISILFNALILHVSAQDCVSIESILVDACTLGTGCSGSESPACNCEGKNEMLRFQLGNNDQNVSDLLVSWPNNPFLGFCQDANTAQNVADLNNTIESCGWLLEPENGVLPAGSSVLLVTSADLCTASNSFAALSDTVYILFQCPGNYQGHFANYGTGLRTTSVTFGGICTSTVTYDRSLLVTQAGTPGAQDGATVIFNSNGSTSYINNGCNAPVPVSTVEAGEPLLACPGETIAISGTVDGTFQSWFWSGGTGTFANPNSLQTTYEIGPGDTGTFTLTLSAQDCNALVTDELEITVPGGIPPEISPAGELQLCPGETIELTASGQGNVTWSDGTAGNTLIVSEPGAYTAFLQGPCGTTETTVEVIAGDSPELSVTPSGSVVLCDGDELTLTASGTGQFNWSDGSTENEITVNAAGNYTVTLSNSCGTAQETIEVVTPASPEITVITESPVALCEGGEVTLSVSGEGTFEWSTGDTGTSVSVNETGIYTVTLSNECESVSENIEVIDGGESPEAEIVVMGSNQICPGESAVLMGVGNGSFSWSNGSTENEIEVFLPGTYVLTVTNDCGSANASVVITQPTAPLVVIGAGNETAICDGQSIDITATSTLPITWSNGVSGNSISVDAPGVYYALVSNECGTDTAFIEVLDGSPLAFFTASTETGEPPLEVEFDNQSEDADFFEWTINGVVVSSGENLDYTFMQSGTPLVTLVATDSAGCSSSYSLTMNIGDCDPLVFIPNTFTPNSDGINDLFRIETNCIEEFELRIYNRWGVLLYTGGQGDPFWDGNNGNGYFVSDGVYVFTMQYKDTDGVEQVLNGTITVFR